MADIPDNRPTFTIVMGCNGCGKTTWKRANPEILPFLYIDMDSIADGIGDWNDPDRREKALEIAEQNIQEALTERASYGVESTFSGSRGPGQLNTAKEHDYRLQGFYFGTDSPEINADRIDRRVREQTGHAVDPGVLPTRWEYSLSNLRKHASLFDELVIFDNSLEYDLRYEDPLKLAFFEIGNLSYVIAEKDRPAWFGTWLNAWTERQKSLKRLLSKGQNQSSNRRN